MNRTLIILSLLILRPAAAQEVREFYNGARALGMGGASIAVVNDETALLSNPAGLGKLRDNYGTILDPEGEGNGLLGNLTTIQAVSDPMNAEKVKEFLDANPGIPMHVKQQLFPSFVVKNFGIGIFWRKTMDAKVDATTMDFNYTHYDDMALIMGYNFRLFDGRVKLGFNGKFISRIAVENVTLPTSGVPVDIKSNGVEGAGIGTDVGLILTGPWTWLPTLSAVVHDVGGTNFNAGSGLRLAVPNRPTKIDQDYDLAIALFPIHSNRVRSSFTIEYQKMTAAALDSDKMRYAHVGYELNLADLFFFRGGMNQRYWTAGMEFASEHIQLQFASYGEDIGTTGSPVEDRRYVLKFAFRF